MVEIAIPYIFRFVFYTAFGLVMETLCAVDAIERLLGCEVPRRVPRKYLEGFVSVYMVPLHGLGVLLVLEPMILLVAPLHWALRYVIYALVITASEVAWGWILDKVLGFYPWDYYAKSRFRMFKRGYTLWTLLPMWGLAGMMLEVYSGLLLHLSPHVAGFFGY